MTRLRNVGGTIIKTTVGDHKIYSEGNIVQNAGGTITEIGEAKGVSFGEPEEAPKVKCPCKCCGKYDVSISDLNEISSYRGEFPSPFQIMNYTPSNTERLLHQVYVPDSTIRQWIKDAAIYHGIPHEMIAVILQQENAPKASKWKQFLQFGERTLTTTAAQIDEHFWGIFPDKVADGSAGFMNMRRPTLRSTIMYTKQNCCKNLMPNDVAERIGYIFNSNVDVGIQGADWRADFVAFPYL